MIIGVDFDGTISEHRFPDIGPPVPGAIEWLKKCQEAGARLILWTMRSDGPTYGPTLTQAVEWCKARGLTFWGVNQNPLQPEWTSSPKAYAHITIDDHNACCPLVTPISGRAYVDWAVVGPWVYDEVKRGLAL